MKQDSTVDVNNIALFGHGGSVSTSNQPLKEVKKDVRKLWFLQDEDVPALWDAALVSDVAKAMMADHNLRIHMPITNQITAGFTYLGQLIAHDISYNRNLSVDLPPQLRLNSIYGTGPSSNCYLFNHYGGNLRFPLSRYVREQLKDFHGVLFNMIHVKNNFYDHVRNLNSIALMADNRNDQNFLVSQLTLAFMQFHNRLAEILHKKEPSLRGMELFERTRNEVTRHFQWVVVHQYLKLLVYNDQLVTDLLRDDACFILYDVGQTPRLMPEFITAAYRLGHSMVNPFYIFNDKKKKDIFSSAGRNGNEIYDLRGFVKRREPFLSWKHFFLSDDVNESIINHAMAIDTKIALPLYELIFLEGQDNSLPARNIRRSASIPVNCDKLAHLVYEAVGYVKSPISKDDVLQKFINLTFDETRERAILPENLPLWLYILLEAEILEEGQRLGPLGSHLVAEQLVWILKHDKQSMVFNDWEPDPLFQDESFHGLDSMSDIFAVLLNGDKIRKFGIQHMLRFVESF